MTQAIELLGAIFGLATTVALAVTLAVAAIGSRLISSRHGSNFLLPLAVVAGFIAGYLMLPREFAALIPQQNQPWQWLPCFAAMAAIFSTTLSPLARPAAWILPLMVSASIAAAVFAPHWPIFGLTRRPLHLIVTMYLLTVGGPLICLPSTLSKRCLLPAFALSGAITAVIIGVMVSTRLAQLPGVLTGALVAAAIVDRWFVKASDRSLRSVIIVFAVLVGGSAWLAFVEPDPPQPQLLVIPLLPLLLWLPAMIRVTSAGEKIG